MSKVTESSVQTNEASNAIGAGECELKQRELDMAVEEAIRRWIEENGLYAFYFNRVTWQCSSGVLTVRGHVPTNRSKNVIWSMIRKLDGFIKIDDQLGVLNSTGLSIVRPR